MKRQKKKFVRHIFMEHCYDFSPAAEIFHELGYTVYEDPSAEGDCFFVSNRRLTFKDFIPLYINQFSTVTDRKEARKWATDAFSDQLNEELNIVT